MKKNSQFFAAWHGLMYIKYNLHKNNTLIILKCLFIKLTYPTHDSERAEEFQKNKSELNTKTQFFNKFNNNVFRYVVGTFLLETISVCIYYLHHSISRSISSFGNKVGTVLKIF